MSLPIVDVSALVDSDSAHLEETIAALRRAASDVGFLYVTGHGVPAARIAALEGIARDFFALPAAAKLEYYIGRSKNHRGYVPPGEEIFYSQTKDTKEAFPSLPASCPTSTTVPRVACSGPTCGRTRSRAFVKPWTRTCSRSGARSCAGSPWRSIYPARTSTPS